MKRCLWFMLCVTTVPMASASAAVHVNPCSLAGTTPVEWAPEADAVFSGLRGTFAIVWDLGDPNIMLDDPNLPGKIVIHRTAKTQALDPFQSDVLVGEAELGFTKLSQSGMGPVTCTYDLTIRVPDMWLPGEPNEPYQIAPIVETGKLCGWIGDGLCGEVVMTSVPPAETVEPNECGVVQILGFEQKEIILRDTLGGTGDPFEPVDLCSLVGEVAPETDDQIAFSYTENGFDFIAGLWLDVNSQYPVQISKLTTVCSFDKNHVGEWSFTVHDSDPYGNFTVSPTDGNIVSNMSLEVVDTTPYDSMCKGNVFKYYVFQPADDVILEPGLYLASPYADFGLMALLFSSSTWEYGSDYIRHVNGAFTFEFLLNWYGQHGVPNPVAFDIYGIPIPDPNTLPFSPDPHWGDCNEANGWCGIFDGDLDGTVEPNEPLAYFKFNKTGGDIVSAGLPHFWASLGSLTKRNRGGGVSGEPNDHCLEFSGLGPADEIHFGVQESEKLVPDVLTMSLYVWPENTEQNGALLSRIDSVTGYINLYLGLADGEPVFMFEDELGNFVQAAAGTTLPRKKWSHITISRDGETASIYADGVLMAAEPYDFEPAAVSASLDISADEFEGRIDEFRIYDGTLSGGDVAELATE